MKNEVWLVVVIILSLLPAGCALQPGAVPSASLRTPVPVTVDAPVEAVDLNVFAASSLTTAFEEIGELFEAAHPEANLVFNFAGSQQLAQQINQGAPADVFASADITQMNVAIEPGSILSGTQQIFATNRLVVVYPRDNPAGLAELKDLSKAGLKLVLAAREAPVGQYSLDFLDKAAAGPAFGADYKENVLQNVVSYEDNVKIVLTKVALGEADAGIVYASDVTGPDVDKVGQIEIPDALNVMAGYPIAAVKDSKNPELALAFIDLVLAPEGQEILAKYGFIPAGN